MHTGEVYVYQQACLICECSYSQAIAEQFLREKYELARSDIRSFVFESENSFIDGSIKNVDQNNWLVFLNSASPDTGVQVSTHKSMRPILYYGQNIHLDAQTLLILHSPLLI